MLTGRYQSTLVLIEGTPAPPWLMAQGRVLGKEAELQFWWWWQVREREGWERNTVITKQDRQGDVQQSMQMQTQPENLLPARSPWLWEKMGVGRRYGKVHSLDWISIKNHHHPQHHYKPWWCPCCSSRPLWSPRFMWTYAVCAAAGCLGDVLGLCCLREPCWCEMVWRLVARGPWILWSP